jgi:NAD(P)H-dependent flavin oxidoreductase YrpB (nitropropane dioxygenase family)
VIKAKEGFHLFKTKITELFQIKYPIIQGGLQGLGTSSIVSAVSEAGGLGLITAGSYKDKEEMKKDIARVQKQTSSPFGVNIAIGIRRPMDEFVEGVIEADIPIVFTSGSNPEPYMDAFKNKGIKVVHVVPSIRFAKKAEQIGCDAVVVIGYECGGHPGLHDTTSLVLISKAVNEVSIPVIGAGGFSSGKGLLAALALGAEGIQMGTRFVATKENPVHENIKQHILKMSENSTVIIKRSIRKPARVIRTELSEKIIEMEQNGATVEELLPYIGGEAYSKLIKMGDLSKGVISAGQVAGSIDKILPAKEVIEQIIQEAEAQLKSMERFLTKA